MQLEKFEDFEKTLSAVFIGVKLTPETRFRELKSYGSLEGMLIIAYVDDDFGVLLNGGDLRSVETLGELFELVRRKLG